MRARVNALLRKLGVPGVLGIGLLLAAGGFYATALQPLQREVGAQRAALQRMRTPARQLPAGERGEELRRFYGFFPSAAQLTDELERLHNLARRAGLELAQGEYRLERRDAGLWSYRVTLPVRGSYPQLRGFLSALLKEMPAASLDGLRFERKRAAETILDAQVRVTLHIRPSGDKS